MKEKMPGVGVGVMLVRGGKVLLGKRHSDPERADSELHGEGTWTLPGGKMRFQETFEECAAREVLEETGIRIDASGMKFVSVSNDRARDAHFVTLCFLCGEFEGQAEVKEPDEIVEWKWFPLDGIPIPMFQPSEKAIKNYLEHAAYKH
jgi:8-oxo-dGTP diphosphatase